MVVDDEAIIRETIREYAEFEGYTVEEAADGWEAVELCRTEDYDIIVMDVMMPKLDGYSAVREIRKVKNIPVLMLSARGQEYDKLFGFEVGVDDYVVKPFSAREILARISAILKRCNNTVKEPARIVFQALVVDVHARKAFLDGNKLDLTLKEFDLLVYLLYNKNIALTRERLLEEVWGYDFYGDDRTLDTHIKTLRGKLGAYREHIATIRGVGYKFEA